MVRDGGGGHMWQGTYFLQMSWAGTCRKMSDIGGNKAMDSFEGQNKEFELEAGAQWKPVEGGEREASHDRSSERSK